MRMVHRRRHRRPAHRRRRPRRHRVLAPPAPAPRTRHAGRPRKGPTGEGAVRRRIG
jgi:hypothetical protein